MRSLWTDEEKQHLQTNYATVDIDTLIQTLNKSRGSILTMASRQGIRQRPTKIYWSEYELKFMADNYRKLPVTEIAKTLNRSESGIWKKYEKMGLRVVNRKEGVYAVGKPYRACLTPEQSDRMADFLRMMSDFKLTADRVDKPARINLTELKTCFGGLAG